jgi:hypothetical protein
MRNPSARVASPDTPPLLSRLFLALVVRPIGAAHSLCGDWIWLPLTPVARGLGAVAGLLTRPWLTRASANDHPTRPLLRFTDMVEGSLGIRGINRVVDASTATREVVFCPFAAALGHATPFCTTLGHLAGVEACRRLVPGSSFAVVRTLSQGHACCEYRFVATELPGASRAAAP